MSFLSFNTFQKTSQPLMGTKTPFCLGKNTLKVSSTSIEIDFPVSFTINSMKSLRGLNTRAKVRHLNDDSSENNSNDEFLARVYTN